MLALFGLSTFGALVSADMPTITLRNGVSVPMLAMGTGGWNDDAAESGVNMAIANGYAHIDTAHDYGCQVGVGKGLKSAERKDLFVTTKVPGCGVPSQHLQPPCYDNTIKLAEEDLTQLDTPYVDLLLLHFPDILACKREADCKKMQEQWAGLEKMYADKKARAIGVSNYCQPCLECLAQTQTVAPMLNQFEFHVGMGEDPFGLPSYCKDKGIAFMAYSPMAHGRLLNNFTAGEAIAKTHNVSSAQVALRYIVEQEHLLVTHTDNDEYQKQDLAIFDFNLTMTDMGTLLAIEEPGCRIEAPGGCCGI